MPDQLKKMADNAVIAPMTIDGKHEMSSVGIWIEKNKYNIYIYSVIAFFHSFKGFFKCWWKALDFVYRDSRI